MGASDTHKVQPAPSVSSSRLSNKKLPHQSSSSSGITNTNAPPPSSRTKALNLLNSKGVTGLMAVVTIYALFGDDIRLATAPKSLDDYFFSFSSFSLALFTAELLLNCYAKDGYKWSFYFWLDSAATISLIPDIEWIWSAVVEAMGDDSDGSSSALKAGRASRAGTKAGRIVRIVRLVRMVRIVKLYKMSKGDQDEDLEAEIANEPSKVGKKMSEMTTRKVIMIVLILVLFIPFFDGGIEESENEYQQLGLSRLQILTTSSSDDNNQVVQSLATDYIRNAGSLLYLSIANVSDETVSNWISLVRFQEDPSSPYDLTINPENDWTQDAMMDTADAVLEAYRTTEYTLVSVSGCFNSQFIKVSEDCDSSVAIFDISPSTRASAGMNILKTFFIMIVLSVASVAFAKIAEALVIAPIERMMNLIKKLAENPLASTKQNGHEFASDKEAKEKGYETALLEATLMKIGALMQVGFGAAGADVIGENMKSGELDPMLPGKKITAIYGFCDIRQFTDTTECLQEEVMVYVNKLGDIMHTGTHSFYGMANKNVGDAFLLSWKICDGTLEGFSNFEDVPTSETRAAANATVMCVPNAGAGAKIRKDITPTEMADSALHAFLKCLIDLDNANTNGCLTTYKYNERVIKRFGRDFKIKMGFGMHVGWAIEGAIGSRFKIDATYISPHVQMADRLEAGSKIFRTPVNLSHWFVALLSDAAASFLRPIDRIRVEGACTPMTVYTFDVENYVKDFGLPRVEHKTQLPVDFANDCCYNDIQQGIHKDFIRTSREAFNLYVAGDFTECKKKLMEITKVLRPNDGPTSVMLETLAEMNDTSPADWAGYRDLLDY